MLRGLARGIKQAAAYAVTSGEKEGKGHALSGQGAAEQRGKTCWEGQMRSH